MSPDEREEGAREARAPGRRDRHLARTLEDLSHVFLSEGHAGPSTPEKLPGVAAPQPSPQSEERPVFLLEDQARPLQRDTLVSLLSSNTGVLEEGLRTIDKDVPMDSGGPVDLVAVDRFGRLCLVNVDASGSDALLMRGLHHFDWFVRHVPIVRRMYHGRVIDFSARPRIFLVAPEFSALFLSAAQHIADAQVHCYLCRLGTGPHGTGILLSRHPLGSQSVGS